MNPSDREPPFLEEVATTLLWTAEEVRRLAVLVRGPAGFQAASERYNALICHFERLEKMFAWADDATAWRESGWSEFLDSHPELL